MREEIITMMIENTDYSRSELEHLSNEELDKLCYDLLKHLIYE